MIWTELQTVFKENNSFLISTHINPDGDCICSELSLYWYLKSLNKETVIYNHDAVPHKFLFLTNTEKIITKKPDSKFDVFISLDSSNPLRLGWIGYDTIADTIVNIDHHRDNTYVGKINIVDVTAAATCQILYNFFTDCAIEYPDFVAETLYAGICTDTGGFQFTNTTSLVLRTCANLVDKGADPSKIYRQIYTLFSAQGLLLRSRVFSTLTYHENYRICCLEMPLSLIDEIGATYGDIEGMADLALTAKSVLIGMFIKHQNSSTHFSLRSNGKIDVGKIAQKIPGGGGHTCAAGCTINLPITEAKEIMLGLVKKELE